MDDDNDDDNDTTDYFTPCACVRGKNVSLMLLVYHTKIIPTSTCTLIVHQMLHCVKASVVYIHCMYMYVCMHVRRSRRREREGERERERERERISPYLP